MVFRRFFKVTHEQYSVNVFVGPDNKIVWINTFIDG